MRIKTREVGAFVECDWTPFIDMTFQLIAFFMVLLNFSDAEVNQLINLPAAELAKPPDGPIEKPLTLQLESDGRVIYSGAPLTIEQLKPQLVLERQLLERAGSTAAEGTVIIRADRGAPTGKVQELIQACQEQGFERYRLRAKQETPSA